LLCWFFGCGAIVALSLWNLLKAENQSVPAASIEHMMRALLFLKTYSKELVLVRMIGRTVDEKVWCESLWQMVDAIGALEPIVVCFFKPMIDDDIQLLLFSNNSIAAVLLIDWDIWHSGYFGNDFLVSVDGTDFHFFKHGRNFFSHKIRNLVLGMRFLFAYCQATKLGSMDHLLVVCGQM
jgi:hypothetical protein